MYAFERSRCCQILHSKAIKTPDMLASNGPLKLLNNEGEIRVYSVID